jgi:GT2 family glycosyltransferase
MSTPSVAIVILNWNGRGFLEKFLPFVLVSTYSNKRVIVADNASTDDSVSFLQNNFPEIEIIINPQNDGFAKGYNTALKQIKSDYYVLLNSDVEVTPGWIEPVIKLMESDLKIAACQPKILSYADRESFEYAGACGGWIDKFGYPFSRGRVFDDCEKDTGQYNNAEPCFWGTGAALFVRSSVYHQMEGLDEYFFAHQEEIDLCWRMQLFGYKIFVEPLSVVYHVGGGTLPKGDDKKVYLNFRNNLIMLAKNLPFFTACLKIPFRFFLDATAAYKELFSGNLGYWLAVFKAHLGFIYWLLFVKRTTPVPLNPSKHFSGWYRGCLIWDYFIKKRRTFKEIVENK